jgi:MraZ protein
VEFTDFFTGRWLNMVDAKGRVSLPAPLRKVIGSRTPEVKAAMLARHEFDQAIAGYDRAYLKRVHELLQRQVDRELDNMSGGRSRFAAAGNAFGSVEEAAIDGSGRIILPPGLRRRAAIGDSAIFVGVGETFEIWGLEVALASRERPDIRDFAEELLAEREERA